MPRPTMRPLEVSMNHTDRGPSRGRIAWRHLVACIQAAKRQQETAHERPRPEAERTTRVLTVENSQSQDH
jgi:hypothetical protein